MSTSKSSISLLSTLQEAEAANDPEAVVRALNSLLEDDFEKAAKTAISGARKHLTKGILCPKYCDAFWNSETPIQFVKAFGTHPVWRWEFWESCLAQTSLPLAVIRQALKTCPQALEEAIRRNEVFLDDEHWEQIKPELQDGSLEGFVEQCELIRDAARNHTKNLERFDELLGKIAPESIVIQFAAWLEQRYFHSDTDYEFDLRIRDYFEILEGALAKSGMVRTTKREAKTTSEIGHDITRIAKRIADDNNIKLDCYPLFEEIERKLDFDLSMTLFAAYGAEAFDHNGRLDFRIADPTKERAWEYTRWKFCAFDTFLTSIPRSENEFLRLREIWEKRANDEGAEIGFQFDAGLRLLLEYLGVRAFEKIEAQIGAKPENILMVLNCYRACMQIQFNKPRSVLKRGGSAHHTSWLMPQSKEESLKIWASMDRSPPRWPIEPRPPEGMTEIVANFFAGDEELKSEARTIFDLFAEDIHAEHISLQDKLLIKNSNCDLLLPRLWSGDVKTFLFNASFQIQNIDKLVSANYEERIESLFRAAEYRTLVSYPLKDGGRTEAEIDVACYRDGTLFLVEAKMTYFRGRPQQVAHVGRTFEKAGHQLQRVMSLLPGYWAEIAERLGIGTGYEETEVIPLIVSNSFEYDHLYSSNTLKVSDFELEMIFRNDPGIISQLAISLSQRMRGEEGETEFLARLAERLSDLTENEEKAFLDANSLYPLGTPPTPKHVIETLENNRFWSKVLGVDFGLTPLKQET